MKKTLQPKFRRYFLDLYAKIQRKDTPVVSRKYLLVPKMTKFIKLRHTYILEANLTMRVRVGIRLMTQNTPIFLWNTKKIN